MASFSLNNITAPNQYQASSTLYPLPVLDHINLDVTNAAIYWQLAQTSQLAGDLSGAWQPETFMPPGSRSIQRKYMVGIRVRAAVAPTMLLPAPQVTIEAVEQ